MSAQAIVWWIIVVAWAVVLGMTVVQALRAVRELNRFNGRLEQMGDLPVVGKLARAEDDVRRIETAVARVAPLAERAALALAVIRRGPVPPEVIAGFRRLAAELAAFRAFARR